MDQRKPGSDPRLAAAEEQMRNWAIGLEVQNRIGSQKQTGQQSLHEVHPYIAISREAGTGGGALAQSLHQLLGWDVLGRELLDGIAERYEESLAMLQAVDESGPNWLAEVFGKWLDHHLVTPSQYVRQLGHIMLASARARGCIFIGRGSQVLLPAKCGISVRLVAPLELRISQIMEIRGLGREQAKALIAETDGRRRDFLARQFGHDIDDPSLYDLIFNRRSLDIGSIAEIIVKEARRRFNVAAGA